MLINSPSAKCLSHASVFCETVGLARPVAPPLNDDNSGNAGTPKAVPTAVAMVLCSATLANIAVECPDQ